MRARLPTRWPAAALAGIVAGGLALGATELLAGLVAGAPSVVLAIGDLLIALQPPNVKQLVVDLFGTADKDILNLAVVLGALGLSAIFGVIGVNRPRGAALGFALLGAVGLLSALRQPLTSPLLAVGSSLVGVWVATAAYGRLRGLALQGVEMPDWDRRRFLVQAGALAGVAVVGGIVGRVLLNRRAAAEPTLAGLPDAQDPAPPLPAGSAFEQEGLTPIVTPNPDFYRIDTALLVPRVDPEGWSLSVIGMVDRPFSIGYAELLAMPLHEQYVTIACVSNEVGGDLVGNARWTGVRLRELLDRAGVQEGATQVVGRAVDGWTAGFPTAWLDEPGREALVAVGMNGEPLPRPHGYPARLIVPGLFGYVSATKWLEVIELTTLEAFDAYWVPLGWAKEAPILTQSRIDVPRPFAPMRVGPAHIAGVAWAPDRGITRVEVQVDDRPWVEAELSTPISDATWVQWRTTWAATEGRHMLRVRATDGTGETQTDMRTRPAPDGARGYHQVPVEVSP